MSVTNAGHAVQDVINLLENADPAEWTPEPPNVHRYWDVAQSEKGPGADQPDEIYVWSPTSTDLEQFSIDGDKFDQTDGIEVQIWSLDDVAVRQLQSDVTEILSGYLDDNAVATPYSTVKPTAENDFREQKMAQSTDHYIMSVELDTRGLSETGLA